MTFIDIYNEEKAKAGGVRPMDWLQAIALTALVSTDTVYSWATGWRFPSRAAASLIATKLDIPADELFPKRKETKQ